MALTAETKTDLYRFFAIAFDAAPGVTYMNQLAAAVESGMTVEQIVEVFTSKTEFTSVYPNFFTQKQFATKLVETVVGTAATAAVKAEAVADIEAALAAGFTRGKVIFQVFNNLAKLDGDAKWGDTAKLLANQVAYAQYYTEELLKGAEEKPVLADLRAVIASVTPATSTATADVAAVLNPPVAPAAKSMTLTTGVDTSLVGGAGDDTYSATQLTLTAGDQLNGGTGTDALAVISSGGALGGGVTSTGVETAKVTATGVTSLNATQFTGLATVENNSSTAGSAVTFSNLASIPAVNVMATNSDTTVTFANANVNGGAADAVTVNLTSSATAANINVTVDGMETVNVVAAGVSGTADNIVAGAVTNGNAATVTSNTMTKLAVTGEGGVRLAANLVGATATVTGTVTSAGGADDISVTADATDKMSVDMGAGADTVRLATVAATWTVSGGNGSDTLVMSTGATSVTGANLADFEAVRITNASAVTLNTAKNTVSAVTFDATGASFTGLASGGTANLTTGGSATVANAAWAAATATSDSLTVNIGNNSLSGATTTVLTADGMESATVNLLAAATDSTSLRTVGLTASTTALNTLKTLVVNGAGAQPVTVTNGGAALTSVTVNAAGNVTATGLTGATAGYAVTSGAGNDILTSGAGNDTLTAGAGNDSISGGAGSDVLDGGDGVDTITGGAGVDVMTGGAGADRFAFSANTSPTTVISTSSASDTITDFVSGTDKLSGTGAVAFLGNFTNIQTALSAATNSLTNVVLTNSAVFVTSENTLYVLTNNNGTLNVDDVVVKMTGVTSLQVSDFLLGAQATGNTVTANGTAASTLNVTQSSTAGTSTTTFLTENNDTINANTTNVAGATLTGGTGVDSLVISNASTATPTALYTIAGNANITGVESWTLPNAQVTGSSIAFNAANFAVGTTYTVNASAHLGLDNVGAPLANTALTIDGSANAQTSSPWSITGGAGNDSIRGGAGNDTISSGAGDDTIDTLSTGSDSVDGGAGNDTITGGAGSDTLIGGDGNDTITNGAAASRLDGGAGNDTINTTAANLLGSTFIGGSGAGDTLAITDAGTYTLAAAAVAGGAAAISGFETITLNGATTLTITPGADVAITGGAGATSITGTGNNITVTQGANQALTLAGTSNYTVSGGTTGSITSTATGTLTVTSSANAQSVTSAAAATVSGATLGAALTVGGAGAFTVTGVGTAAGATVTEAATATGALTISTAGTNGVTVTEVAGATGAVVMNVAGTGAVTFTAVSSHASQTVNLNNTGAVTVQAASTAAAYTISVGGTAGARTYANNSTTVSVDTYTGGTGIDDVTGGLGGDVINLGVDTAADIVRIAAGDTAIALGFAASTAVPTTAITTAGMDIITNFGSQDTIVLTGVNTTGAATTLIRNGGTMPSAADAANTSNALILGVYNSAANTFTPSLTGTDSLFVFDSNGATNGGQYRGVILVGFTDPAQNDQVTAANPAVLSPTGG